MVAPAIPVVVGWGVRELGLGLLKALARSRLAPATRVLPLAMESANQLSAEQDRADPCENCDEIPCFNKPEGADPEEFRRQLREQQDAINSMSPDDLLANMQRYAEVGRSAGDAAARQTARSQYAEDLVDQLINQFVEQGMSPADAERSAIQTTDVRMRSMDATHTLDLVAGGDGSISGMGDRQINRSMGAQWSHGRAHALKQAAEKAKSEGKERMNVDLKEC